MMKKLKVLQILLVILIGTGSAAILTGCGDDDSSPGADPRPSNNNAGYNNVANNSSSPGNNDSDGDFVEEREEFLVREVAATDRYVFVPNSAPGSNTVAMIDGQDLSIVPFRVGLEPTEIRAVLLEDVGSVAYVLCEGSAALAIIRADASSVDAMSGEVRLLKVPREVNALAMAPDGRHVLAYIDPTRPLRSEASVASLQTMALIRLGESAEEDRVFELSVTRLISSIQFSADGREAFVLGREGVNRIVLDEVQQDAFVPPIALNLADDVFPPGNQQIAVSADGSFMVVRTSQFAGIAVYQFETEEVAAQLSVIELSAIPTDLKLIEQAGTRTVLAALRDSEEVALLDVDAFFAGADVGHALRVLEVDGAQAGLVQVTPDRAHALVYSGLTRLPLLGVIDLESESTRLFSLRNQIRSVAISPDSEKAIVVHRKQAGSAGVGADPMTVFQHSHGMTILDIASGYMRALVLQGEPTDVVLTKTQASSVVYALLESSNANNQGVVRIDLTSFRSDFVRLPRKPVQIGQVAGKIFVHQEAPTGRITFFDIETQAQRTVSGYELNAGIDR